MDQALRFEHFELHPAERALRVRGEAVALGSRAFDVLLVLAQRHERLVTKQELLDLVWPGLVVEEHNVATQIGNLRKLLGTDAIATLPGYGYRLTAPRAGTSERPGVPAAPAAARARHNLPDPRTRFIGREAALADLARLLPSTRLLTLTGIGGCGKTRLALQLARQQTEAFADGVWFVDLAPLQEAGRAASACAAVLGLEDDGTAPLVQRLVEHLALRRMLLVLDNCEHVLEAAAPLVEALLAGALGVTLLATSREGLRVAGEQIYPVRSLSLPAMDDLVSVLAAESVRVFVDRVRLVRPDFEVNASDAAPLAEICRRLDGIALAIELAAARVTTLPIAEIARRLDDRFRLLTGGHRSLPRHQTLLSTMQWSHEQLTAAEQRMLRQMSVFAGGWTLRAAADVAALGDEYEALTLLTALHDKSLVVVDPVAPGGEPRYRMLETVRQYALERLDECGEADVARGRHVAHFIAMAEEAERHVRGPDQDLWMGRYKQEHENLVAALTWCCAAPLDPQCGLRLAAATGYYWVWNSVELGWRLTMAVLEQDRTGAITPAREGALRYMAKMSEFRGRYDETLDFAQQSLAAARQLGEPGRLVWALDIYGLAMVCVNRLEPALKAKEEALDLARRLGDGAAISAMLNNLAAVKSSAGDVEAAERYFRESLEWARHHSGRVANVLVLDNLVRLLVARDALEEARQLVIECLPLARDEKVSVDLLEVSVGLASKRGEHHIAARFWGAADRQARAWGYHPEPGDFEHTEPLLESSRRAIGNEAFDAEEAAGRAMPFEQAMGELARWLRVEE
jgi:predicted ATPase/DNA-binding winged helix-turn-helix (wHTH) protein